ncbi:hypothetical protein SDC9_85676 [bioreactor metagenome]|uniref:Uncharacterized protein n=1 Tax=bioreactor metagenome TaxID=1076179 RepID=A0A644ZDT2_9ZZZZ
MVAIQPRFAAHGRHVRSGVRLGQRERGNRLAPGHARQVALFLRRRSGKRNSAGAQPLHRERKISQTAVARQRFANQADGAGVDLLAGAAPLRARHCMPGPSRIAQQTHEATAFGIHVRAVRIWHMLCRPGIQR